MEKKLFREKSLEKISSPEQLDDYLHVITPAVWAVLLGIVIMLAVFFYWCSETAVESYVDGSAVSANGVMSISFNDQKDEKNIREGMNVRVGNLSTQIDSLGKNGDGRILAIAKLDIPDGKYNVKVGYNRVQIISFLFN